MVLINDALIQRVPKLYQSENINIKDKMLQIRYYATNSSWQWYLVEYDEDTKTAFGYVVGYEKEWGYFSLKEFQEINDDETSMIKIKRDTSFIPIRFSDLKLN